EQERGEVDGADQQRTHREGAEATGIEEGLRLRKRDEPEPDAAGKRHRHPGGEDGQRWYRQEVAPARDLLAALQGKQRERGAERGADQRGQQTEDRKSTRLNSSH